MFSWFKELVKQYVIRNNMETSFKEGKPGPKWIRKFLRRNKLTMKKTEMIISSRISNTSNLFIIYDFYDALAKVFNESIKYKVHYGYSYSMSSYG